MLQQEKKHLLYFNNLSKEFKVRPSLFLPFWHVAGWGVGAGTALMGSEAAMACTEAVETIVGNHYNDQLRKLAAVQDLSMLEKSGVDMPEFSNTADFSMPLAEAMIPLPEKSCKTSLEELRRKIKECRDEELEHLYTSVEKNAIGAPFYYYLSRSLKVGCSAAIKVAKFI
jgi:3-demethoxyubiquinol 3-hydroxylase